MGERTEEDVYWHEEKNTVTSWLSKQEEKLGKTFKSKGDKVRAIGEGAKKTLKKTVAMGLA